jgi:hypothetical protein
MKIRPVGAELFHADGQTDRHDEANSRFSQFCETRLKMTKSPTTHMLTIFVHDFTKSPLLFPTIFVKSNKAEQNNTHITNTAFHPVQTASFESIDKNSSAPPAPSPAKV